MAALGFGVVLAGGRFAVAQLKTAVSQLQLFETTTALETLGHLANRWDSQLLIRARQFVFSYPDAEALADAIQEEDDKNSEDYFAVAALIGFFEELGYLCSEADKNLTIRKYVNAIFYLPVLTYYPRLEKHVNRKNTNDEPQLAEHFKNLYDGMKNG